MNKEPYSTHQQMVVKYLLQATGNIIELGSGHYSTPLIHEIAEARGLNAETVDNDKEWLRTFKHLESDRHSIRHINSWNEFVVEKNYSVAFVDHADPPTHPRWLQVLKLIPYSDIIIVHDSEDTLYGYGEIMNMVSVVESDTRHQTHTLVLRPKHRTIYTPPGKAVVAISTYRTDNDLADLLRVVDSCRATSDAEIRIYDDGSCVEYQAALLAIPNVVVSLSSENRGIAHTKNRGLSTFNESPDVDIVFLCDDDIEFKAGWLEKYTDALKTVPLIALCDPTYDTSFATTKSVTVGNLTVHGFQNGAFVGVTRRAFSVAGWLPEMPEKYGVEHCAYYMKAVLHGIMPWQGFIDAIDGNQVISIYGVGEITEPAAIIERHRQIAGNRASQVWIDLNKDLDYLKSEMHADAKCPCELCGTVTESIEYQLGWCSRCDHVTRNTDYESIRQRYHALGYVTHNGDFANLKRECATNVNLIRKFKPVGPVLDIGHLEGACMAAMRDARMDVYGYDVSKEANAVAIQNGIDATRIQISDMLSADMWPHKFAAIMIREVIEHVSDPEALLRTAGSILVANGIIQIQTPRRGSESRLWAISDHLRTYSQESLVEVARRAGLKEIDALLWPGGMCLTFRKVQHVH